MVIVELGIVRSGVPLVSKQYYDEHKIADSSVLRAGFLSGLNAFVQQTFSDQIDSFVMKNYIIMMRNHPTVPITVYCIGDKKLKPKVAEKALTQVLDEFIKKYGDLAEFKGDITMFDEFQPVIDGILRDLIRKPDDRVRSVF